MHTSGTWIAIDLSLPSDIPNSALASQQDREASAAGDDWTQIVAGGGEEVVGEVGMRTRLPDTSSRRRLLPSLSNITADSIDTARPTDPYGPLDQPFGRCHTIDKRRTSSLLDCLDCNTVPRLWKRWHFAEPIWTNARQRLCICRCFGC